MIQQAAFSPFDACRRWEDRWQGDIIGVLQDTTSRLDCKQAYRMNMLLSAACSVCICCLLQTLSGTRQMRSACCVRVHLNACSGTCAARNPATKVSVLFAGEAKDSRAEVMGPLLIVSLLGRVPSQAPAAAAGSEGDEVLARLQRLVNLLESYFHPSNTGQCAPCSAFPLAMCKARSRCILREFAL